MAKRRPTLRDLGEAVKNDHYCSMNTCDIEAARKAGCYAWAADLLMSATETDETAEVFAKVNPSPRTLEAERKRLLREVKHSDCPECNAIVWDSAGTRCDNCGGVSVARGR